MKYFLTITFCSFLLLDTQEAKTQEKFWDESIIHQIHLQISNEEWEAMQPAHQRDTNNNNEDLEVKDEEQRKLHRSRFPWSQASITINGTRFNDIGIRYKGNASFNLMHGSLKRNLKIKLDWVKEKQNYFSIETLNFNAGGLDPSKLREALGYWVFRKAGLPAPMTTFAEITLTIPGQYDYEFLGLYTIVEQVNKVFLKEHFGSKSGLLMKPEGVASVEYHGDDWKFYPHLYRPDDEPTLEQSSRVIEFAKLVHLGNDKHFEDSINSFLNVDSFLHFIALNGLIANLDTILAMPQNYYLHLNKKTNKFLFFPWDLDISFAGWPLGGPPKDHMNLSLVHPHSSDEHILIDRLLATKSIRLKYDQIVQELVDEIFLNGDLYKKYESLEEIISSSREKDLKAIKDRNERAYPAPRGYQPPSIKLFIRERTESITRQMNKPKNGYVFQHKRPGARLGHLAKDKFGRGRLALHILIQGDLNQDGVISRRELRALLGGWFDEIEQTGDGKLEKENFVNNLPEAFFPNSGKPPGKIPELYVAEGLFSLSDSDGDGIAVKKSLISAFETYFKSRQIHEDAHLNEQSLRDVLRSLIKQ